MKPFPLQPEQPFSAILFDCDGTLSAIEGIDELAHINQVGRIVQAFTQQAMSQTGMSLGLYEKRLALVKPTKTQVEALGHLYIKHQAPDIAAVISLFNRLKKPAYVISAGLLPSILPLGDFLGIPPSNIFAVDIYFDQKGHYLDFDRQSPLINRQGKCVIVNHLKKQHPHLLYIGDGLNDLETKNEVERFIGYGGFFYRKHIEEQCEFYIKTPSMRALLPYSLTRSEVSLLTDTEKTLYENGMKDITS